MLTIRTRAALALLLVAMLPASASAQVITVGPYTFPSEAYFADTAQFHGDPASVRWDGAWDSDWTVPGDVSWLIGFSPYDGFSNLGCHEETIGGVTSCFPTACSGIYADYFEILDFGFVDIAAVNGPGPDLVVFDSRNSSDNYEVAVRPRGGAFTDYRIIRWEDQTPTGYEGHGGPDPDGRPGNTLWGVDVDLTTYGILPGTLVDMLRVRQGCSTTPPGPTTHIPQADPAMAAVLHAPCACDDGNECTWDCDSSGTCTSTAHDPGTPCSSGVCDGTAAPSCVECVADANCSGARPRCDIGTQLCVECLADVHCADEDECSLDACTAGICVHAIAPAGSACTGGVCDGEPEPTCVACLEDGHCDDALECTLGSCVDGTCSFTPASRGTPCERGICDGDPIAPRCAPCATDADCGEFTPFCTDEGICVACREDASCPSSECASDVACVEGTCEYEPVTRGTECAAGGFCDGAARPSCIECVAGLHCDDGDRCTADACVDDTCQHAPSCVDGGPPAIDAGHDSPRSGGCSCRTLPGGGSSASFLGALACLALLVRRRSSRVKR